MILILPILPLNLFWSVFTCENGAVVSAVKEHGLPGQGERAIFSCPRAPVRNKQHNPADLHRKTTHLRLFAK